MKKVNALSLRQNLGKVLKSLESSGSPILIERNSKPAAVMISLEDYQTRFSDRDADEKRKQIIQEILNTKLKVAPNENTLELIRQSRR